MCTEMHNTGGSRQRSATLAQSTGGQLNGLISKIIAVPGQRDALAAILLEGTKTMPGCLSYVIASDPADDKALCIYGGVGQRVA